MARASLVEKRKPEILEAFARCIGRYGVAGTSLEAIAAAAGMRRSILRHFVGNREQLLLETARYMADRIGGAAHRYATALAAGQLHSDDEAEVDWLTGAQRLIEEADRNLAALGLLRRARQGVFEELVIELRDRFPDASPRVAAVATALMALRRQAAMRIRSGEPTLAEDGAAQVLIGTLGFPAAGPGAEDSPASVRSLDEERLSEDTEIGLND